MNSWKTAASVAALLLAGFATAAQPQVANNHQAEMLLQEAKHRALVDGDLERAIELCKKIVTEYNGNRALVAKALVQMGGCYEKLGRAEAQKAYQRVIQEFAEQQRQVAIAKERLAGMERENGKSEVTIRKIWGPHGTKQELRDDNYYLYGVTRGNDARPSPNGRYIAYTNWGPPSIAVYELTTGESRDITDDGTWDEPPTGDEWGEYPIWSPDGCYVAYMWCIDGSKIDNRPDHCELRVVGIEGGEPRVLYRTDTTQEDIRPHDWSPDGKTILVTIGPYWDSKSGVSPKAMLISMEDGTKRILNTSEQGLRGFADFHMFFSPDGRYIAYDSKQSNDLTKRDIYLLKTSGNGDSTPLVKHPADDQVLGWTPDGKRLLFATDRTGVRTMALIEVREGQSQGNPQSVRLLPAGFQPIGLTRNGVYYYSVRIDTHDVYTATLDLETGNIIVPPVLVNVPIEGMARMPCWSSDGQYLAYLSRPTNNEKVSITIRSVKTNEVRVVEHSNKIKRIYPRFLEWSPNGKSFLILGVPHQPFTERRSGGLFEMDAQTGDVSLITHGTDANEILFLPTWSLDGRSVFYQRARWNTSNWVSSVRILKRNLETDKEREIAKDVSFGSFKARHFADFSFSPDGRRIAFVSQEVTEDNSISGSRLKVKAIAGGEATELFRMRRRITLQGWTPDGRYILFQDHEKGWGGDKRNLWRIPAAGGEPRKIELTMKEIPHLRVHPDGRQVAFDVKGLKLELWAMENFLPKPTAVK